MRRGSRCTLCLHDAEQALAAGQLQAARAAADEIRARRPGAGPLPKPTLQRLGRLMQQLMELEGWESFGQQQARIQLCERAEAAATLTLDAPQPCGRSAETAQRMEALSTSNTRAYPRRCGNASTAPAQKAYAPAARYFAEQAALQKQARKQREEYIAAAAAQAPTLLVEPRDWRAIERWLRETDRRWRDGDLGSVDPKAWKGLDARFKAALAPLRDALSAARDQAKARRLALIEEAAALAAKAQERDAPTQVKAIQAKWQAQAKELLLTRRDERALWEQFRAACDAVFQAREAKRKEEDDRKHEARRALEGICVQLEQLALATDTPEQDLRRGLRDLQEQWTHEGARIGSANARPGITLHERKDGGGDRVVGARACPRSGGVAEPWRRRSACARSWTPARVRRRHGGRCGAARTVDRAAGAPCRMGESDGRAGVTRRCARSPMRPRRSRT